MPGVFLIFFKRHGNNKVLTNRDFEFKMPANDVKLTAQVKAIIVNYHVEHYQKKLNKDCAANTTNKDDNYVLVDREKFTGLINTTVTPELKTYTGFTPEDSVKTVTIMDDGSTLIKYYYARNNYDVDIKYNTGWLTEDSVTTYQFDETVTLEPELKPGYHFDHYEVDYEVDMTAKH